MGFSYSHFGLCCDFCGHSEPEYNVNKIPCPYGYCQAWACCKYCHEKKKHLVCSIGKTERRHSDICKTLSEYFVKYGPGMFNHEEVIQYCKIKEC